MMLNPEFGEVEAQDADGRTLRLREVWSQRPCALVFVRHFGCSLCRRQMAELRPHLREIRDAGGDLVVVGTGAPHFARAFQEELGLGDVRMISDVDGRAYRLAGFRRGAGTLFSPAAIWNYVSAFLTGYSFRGMQGDGLQQGGVLVIRPGGEVVYRYESRRSGDHPDPSAIVAALRSGGPSVGSHAV
jgi:peroxiredoxin